MQPQHANAVAAHHMQQQQQAAQHAAFPNPNPAAAAAAAAAANQMQPNTHAAAFGWPNYPHHPRWKQKHIKIKVTAK